MVWLGKSGCLLTHPDIATLVDPLFSFAGKRVGEMSLTQPSPKERALKTFLSLPLWERFGGGFCFTTR